MSGKIPAQRRLPKQPNLQQLRKQAKDLLHRYRAGDADAVAEVQRFERKPDPSSFALHDAQRVLARAYGYASWTRLKAVVDGANLGRLAEAVQRGDVHSVRKLLRARPELVGMDMAANDERRALHYAVVRRDGDMVRLLMRAGADARKGIFPHRDATSALAMARDREYHDIVAIIEEEEHLRTPEPTAVQTPLQGAEKAVADGDLPRIRQLIQDDAGLLGRIRQNGGLLTLAVRSGQLEAVRLLLDLGADVDERILLEELEEPTPSWGMPLWYAALENRRDIAELLLDRGADPNANVYASGWPLRNAWNHEDDSLKRLLLERGAKRQPYMIAEAHDVAEARRLLEADPSEEMAEELVVSAADHGCAQIVELALARLTWPRADGRWHWVLIQPMRGARGDGADNRGHFGCMQLLLRHGIDPNVERFGQTALHFIAARHNLSGDDRARFAAILLDHGATLDIRDELLQSTPLGWACRWGRRELVDFLISRGAPVDEPDAEPWATPRAWARKMGHSAITAVLDKRETA